MQEEAIMTKFYVTTPIYYINDIPHIGHAYTTTAADVLARYYKKKYGNDEIFFLTGTDEHGAKIATAAKEASKNPQEFADSIVPKFKESWEMLNIEYDHFFRTTDSRHEELVKEILQTIYDKGLIYEGIYEGLYCEGCEKFLSENELVDGKCPLHPNKTPVHQKEKNYFFKLSKFKDELIKDFENGNVDIKPASKKNEILGKLKEELKDIAISREEVSWGIPIPWDENQTIYVWVEALFNYYTATKFLEGKGKFWPADVHLIGKDILWFHTVIWCALLKAANLELPKKVFAHGFFTINGAKMSKSLGNVISPKELVEKFGADSTRYLLLSQFPFGQDGDFSIEKLEETYNAHLANGLGNLVARVARLAEKVDIKIHDAEVNEIYGKYLEDLQFTDAINYIQKQISELDEEIDRNEPWKISDLGKLKEFLDPVIGKILIIAGEIEPFMPDASEKIKLLFSGEKVNSIPPLFPRI
jgi:methionyl-tRNA synthetase